jgi:hypothetical protein
MLAAAPFDDWWHRRFGRDATLWSPPHLLGVLGASLIILGLALALATELDRRPRISRAWLLAPLTLLLPAATLPMAPARSHGPLYTLLAAAFLPFVLLLTDRLFRQPGSMLAVAALFIVLTKVQDEFVPLAFYITMPPLRSLLGRGGLNVRGGASVFPPYVLLPALALELALAALWVLHRWHGYERTWQAAVLAGLAFPLLFYVTEAARYTTATGRLWPALDGLWLIGSLALGALSGLAGHLLALHAAKQAVQ